MLEHMDSESAAEWLQSLDAPLPEDPTGASTKAVPDEEFDDSFDQIKQ
jgi:hypothetical protein